MSCTLSFNRTPFFCMIPWPAVFALVGENGQAMVWAEDVPAEVAAQAQAQKAPEKPRPHLRSVGEGESAPPAAAKAEPPTAAEKKRAAKVGKAPAKSSGSKAEASKGTPKAASKAKAATSKAVKATPKTGASRGRQVAVQGLGRTPRLAKSPRPQRLRRSPNRQRLAKRCPPRSPRPPSPKPREPRRKCTSRSASCRPTFGW